MRTRKVLYSPGWGAGWMTWNPDYAEDFLFDADLIDAVEQRVPLGDENDPDTPLGAFKVRLIAKHGEDAECAYLGGAHDLRVAEVRGDFQVDEYDGNESIRLRDAGEWF